MIAAFDTSLASETVSQLCKINDRQWGEHRNAFVSMDGPAPVSLRMLRLLAGFSIAYVKRLT
jgi:hypothetical protein